MTHVKRLRGCAADLTQLLAVLAGLEPRVGSLLVQLPPHVKCDRDALAELLSELPVGTRAAAL